MAEIRCPMCGKLNPEGLDVCQFCQARLTPLIINPEDQDSPLAEIHDQPAPDDGENIPDWLRSMGDDEPLDEGEEAISEPGEGDDWLGRLQAAGDQFEESEPDDEQVIDTRPSTAELSQRLGRSPTPMDSIEIPGTDDLPDWFARLDETEDDKPPDPRVEGIIPPFQENIPDRDAIPDWLERLQQSEETESPVDESLPPDARQGAMPTLDSVFAEDDDQPADVHLPDAAKYSELDSPGLPEWLRELDEDIPEPFQLRDQQSHRVQEQTPKTPSPFFDEENLEEDEPSGLLSRLSAAEIADSRPESRSEVSDVEEDVELPDWLANMDVESTDDSAVSPSPGAPAGPEVEPQAELDTDSGEMELPPWIEGGQMIGDDVDFTIKKGVMTGWLSELKEEDDLDAADAPDDAEAPSLGLPDSPETEPQAEPEDNSGETELPPWVEGGQMIGDDPDFTIKKGIMTGWLSELKEEDDLDVDSSDELEEIIEEEENLPDWLAGIEIDRSGSELTLDDEDVSEFPDWLSQIGPPSGLDAADDDEIDGESEKEDLDWLSALPDAADFDEVDEGAAAFDASMAETITSGDVPDWLKDIEPSRQDTQRDYQPPDEEPSKVPALSLDEDDDLTFDDSLPEWLSSASLESKQLEEYPPLDDELTPADMPGWLAAMKPVEVTTSDDDLDTGEIENAGPLVGLRSVLPAEPDIARVRKSVSQTIKLQVPENQLTKASLLEQVLESEGTARDVPREAIVTTQQLMRLLIAIIMVGAITLVTFLSTEWTPLPDRSLMPAEVLDASRFVSAVEQEMPVLVAFDYEPGTNGEMTAAAKPILDHLMLKGAYLATVSTSPTGPALADHFINDTLAEHEYVGGTHFVNLGFIPGGASGLLGFAESPQVFTPFSFEGWDAWATNPVQGVDSLDDFALLLVLTDDPATARYWIEQVEPKVPNTPMILVTSAQATPLVRPYYQSMSPQVDGLISGFVGGLEYEQILGTSDDGLGRSYWDAFNVGLIIAAIAILVGAVINGLGRLNRRQPPAKLAKEGE